MRYRIGSSEIFHLAVIVAVGLGLLKARSWPYETALFPMATGITVIVVAIVSLFLELRKKMAPAVAAGPSQDPEEGAALKAFSFFGWLAGFIAAIWLLGYVVASLLYVFLYMKVKGKQHWLITILVTAGAYAFMAAVFDALLGIRWFPGALWEWLGF